MNMAICLGLRYDHKQKGGVEPGGRLTTIRSGRQTQCSVHAGHRGANSQRRSRYFLVAVHWLHGSMEHLSTAQNHMRDSIIYAMALISQSLPRNGVVALVCSVMASPGRAPGPHQWRCHISLLKKRRFWLADTMLERSCRQATSKATGLEQSRR